MEINNLQTESSTGEGKVFLDGPPILDKDGERAAGWLTEELSQPPHSSSAPEQVSMASPGQGNSLGDRLLRGMQSIGEAYKKKTGEVIDTLNSSESDMMSITKILRIQVELAEVSLQADVTVKGITKVPQQIDQITRTQ